MSHVVNIVNDPLEAFCAWRTQVVRENSFECTPIAFDESREWHFENGYLRHRTGGWFFLAGLTSEARHPRLNAQQQLIIIQRQIAINGFLARPAAAGLELLFQGRVEPGNIGGMQLAPTVQSTVSNYKRLHGGKPTPFIDFFLEPDRQTVLFDCLQSEEATRYLGKYNQNIVVRVSGGLPAPDGFRWYDLSAIRQFAVSSNVLNTDARSVLSCLDWTLLAGPAGPFSGHPQGSFGAALKDSFNSRAHDADSSNTDVLSWLARLRAHAGHHAQVVPIPQLKNWLVQRESIREIDHCHGFEVRQFRVVATGREVKSWDQPLITSTAAGRLALVFQKRGTVLQVLVKASYEIGFLEGVQLSASISIPPGSAARDDDPVERVLIDLIADGTRATLVDQCRQSEEGGRFYREENDYELVWLDPSVVLPVTNDYRWLTLHQVRELIRIPGVFSIEFRGVLALLLTYL